MRLTLPSEVIAAACLRILAAITKERAEENAENAAKVRFVRRWFRIHERSSEEIKAACRARFIVYPSTKYADHERRVDRLLRIANHYAPGTPLTLSDGDVEQIGGWLPPYVDTGAAGGAQS